MKRTTNLITLLVLLVTLLAACDDKINTMPTALFSISPNYGSVDSVFTFDASESRDIEDPTEDLRVRWDWESDSIFDTDYSTDKVIQHQFPVGGTHYITLEVIDTKGMSTRKTDFIRITYPNRAPNANFVVLPESGYLQDVFIFDASSTSDAEDNNNDVFIRWDFNGDGTWDTEYTKEKVAEHQYENAGEYDVVLQAKDSEGLTDEEHFTLVVGGMNESPEAPVLSSPSSENTQVSTRCLLEWSCHDPENDDLLFDVYFGTTDQPTLVATNVESYSYLCKPLVYNAEYYWKVVAKDPYDHVISSNVWHFTTWSPDYPMATITDSRDGKVYKTVEINGKLWFAQNLNVGSMINQSTGGDFNDGYQKDNNKSEKYCYNNEQENCDLYGGLYQWEEAMGYSESPGATGICPPGWHVPDTDEWQDLYLYFEDELGVSAGENLAWGGKSGFEMLYSGYLIFAERKFYDLAQAGYAWSSTINPNINHLAMVRSVFDGKTDFQDDTFQRVSGLPVRCLKDN